MLNLIVIWVYDSSKSSILSFILILYFKFDRPILKHVYNRIVMRDSSGQQLPLVGTSGSGESEEGSSYN